MWCELEPEIPVFEDFQALIETATQFNHTAVKQYRDGRNQIEELKHQRVERIALFSNKTMIAIDQPQTGIYQVRMIRFEYAANQQRNVFGIKQIIVIQETNVLASSRFETKICRRRALQWTSCTHQSKARICHNGCRQWRMTSTGSVHHHHF